MGRISRLGPIARCTGEYVHQLDSGVWLHLRTFRKYLFDAIDVEDPKLDGDWIHMASDWAIMVPMVEVASSPKLIAELTQVHEPVEAKRGEDWRQRDSVIARILRSQCVPSFGGEVGCLCFDLPM